MARSYTTRDAARYLSERGKKASPSLLQKQRTRGPDDRRDRGPSFWRDPEGRCWYDEQTLDQYLAEKLSARRLRGSAPVPVNFRRAG